MQAKQTQFDIKAVQTSWQAFDSMTHLRPIRNEADYDRTVFMMNSLLDVVGDDEDHPMAGLLEIVGDLVWNYEQEHHPIEAVEPKGFSGGPPIPHATPTPWAPGRSVEGCLPAGSWFTPTRLCTRCEASSKLCLGAERSSP